MPQRIEGDLRRFKDIVKKKVRENLGRYISNPEWVFPDSRGRKVRIPVPQIDLPHFQFGDKNQGGVGQGEGEPGDILGPGENDDGSGSGKAGDKPGEHDLMAELSYEEFAEMLKEELGLPRIENRGKKGIMSEKERYTSIRRTGHESLRHARRTLKEAMKRQISSGNYDPLNPKLVPVPVDRRYRSWKTYQEPAANAVIIYMMDVSGSMGDEQKSLVRKICFWIDIWLRMNYKGIQSRYIIHDANAKEVDQDTFYRVKESGGTMISSAYTLCSEIVAKDYPFDDWNIYPIHFSDGDNWSVEDTKKCLELVKSLAPRVNQFSYAQIHSPYGNGEFIKHISKRFKNEPKVVVTEVEGSGDIIKAMKELLGRGN